MNGRWPASHDEEAALRAVFQTAQDGVLIHEKSRIVQANGAACEMLGYEPDELVGKEVSDLVPHDYAAAIERNLALGKADFEGMFVMKDGRETSFAATVREAPYQGRPAGIMTLRARRGGPADPSHDANLKRLQEADLLKTRILNTAAHELNTPLTPIRLQIHMLKSGALGPLDERQMRAVSVVDRNVHRLASLVQEILDVARLQSGHLKVVLAPLSAQEAVDEAFQSYAEVARGVGVSLEATIEPGLSLMADRQRLQQVLFNLLSNAIKFTPTGGRIEVTAHSVAGNGMAELSVHDTGPGMEGQQIARLFQPFSQVHDPQQTDKPGTGLGLYICRGILEAHGGTIRCESKGRGEGTTFTCTIPITQAMPMRVPDAVRMVATRETAVPPPKETPLGQRLRQLI